MPAALTVLVAPGQLDLPAPPCVGFPGHSTKSTATLYGARAPHPPPLPRGITRLPPALHPKPLLPPGWFPPRGTPQALRPPAPGPSPSPQAGQSRPRAHRPSAMSPTTTTTTTAGRTVTASASRAGRRAGPKGAVPQTSHLTAGALPAEPRRVPERPSGSATASADPRRRPDRQPFCKLRRPPQKAGRVG